MQTHQIFACFNEKPLVTPHPWFISLSLIYSLKTFWIASCLILSNYLTSSSFLTGKTKQEKLVSKDNSGWEKIRVCWDAFHIVRDGKHLCALVHIKHCSSTGTGINPAVHIARGMHPHRRVRARPLLGHNFALFAYTFNVR